MTLSHMNTESYKAIQAVINQLLIKQNPECKIMSDINLILVKTASDSFGLTILGGDWKESFSSAYSSFKQLYREKYSSWGDRCLSFVACYTETQDDAAFLNSIAMDVYFCRKYVIRYSENTDILMQELMRLPFLPMNEGKIRGVVRPPSAQALLNSIGVSSLFSRQLIVPGLRSAQKIIDDYSDSSELLSIKKVDAITPSGLSEHDILRRTRITRISIEAFRAYKKKQEFDLDADVIVIYGQNGLGKTSFFDAIDFVSTGRIGRLCQNNSMNQERFASIARHLGVRSDDGSVTMNVNNGTSDIQIKRNINDWSCAIVDNEKIDRTDTIQLLTSAKWGEKKERIEHLERLFRATHLFSQNIQELLIDFEKDSTLSSELVSRTFALEDYASGRKKLQEIINILDRQIQEEDEQLYELDNQLQVIAQRIDELPHLQETVQAGQQITKMATDLHNKMRTDAGLIVTETSITNVTVREWRSVLEAQYRGTLEQFSRLQNLELKYPQYEDKKNNRIIKTSVIENLCLEMKIKNDELKQKEIDKNAIAGNLEQNRNSLIAAREKLNNLMAFKRLRDDYISLQQLATQLGYKLKKLDVEAVATADKVSTLYSALEEAKMQRRNALDAHEHSSCQIIRLNDIIDNLDIWKARKDEARILESLFESESQSLKETSNCIDDENQLLAGWFTERDLQEREYSNITKDQAELITLLDKIESHVTNGICPTCGIEHRSRAELIQKIHEQKNKRPVHVEKTHEGILYLNNCIDEHTKKVQELELKKEMKHKESLDISRKLSALNDSNKNFEKLLMEIGLSPVDSDLPNKVLVLRDKESSMQESIMESVASSKIIEDNTLSNIAMLEKQHSKISYDRESVKRDIESLDIRLSELLAKINTFNLSINMTSEEQILEQKMWDARISHLEQQIEPISRQVESLDNYISKARIILDDLNQTYKKALSEKTSLEHDELLFRNSVLKVMSVEEVSQEKIIDEKNKAANAAKVLEGLTSQAITVERSFDAVQRSAMLSELDIKSRDIISCMEELRCKKKKNKQAKKLFSELGDILSNHSARAIEDHVNAFGPITTLLQNRLRAVFGFGDIVLYPTNNQIRVEVDWDGIKVKPTEYFSDSQKQILMLSLFMSERITQTWSGFTPVLLDDPVTHFDDLNAFSFVELIRGLVTSSPGSMQFIISTCEERLFELMQQKLGKTAIYYHFEGIDKNGPIVTKLVCKS